MLSEDDSGGSVLYDAACHLRELLRGRAALLIVDRTDIVDAAEADGVLLSPRGATCALAPSTPMSYGRSTNERCPAWLACFTICDTSQEATSNHILPSLCAASPLHMYAAGLPTGVARRMMSGGASLVGRMVSTADESATAAKDGANFVVLQVLIMLT